MRVLVLNPGSTSTKLAWFEDGAEQEACRSTCAPDDRLLPLTGQLESRRRAVEAFIAKSKVPRFDAIIALGGLLRAGPGGVYAVDGPMLTELRAERHGAHASGLGALIAAELCEQAHGLALVADPISTDELCPVARISGVPGIERWGRSHALSLKAAARRAAAALGRPLAQTRLVGLHLGGGISVAALRAGRIVDVNDAMLGMGPFSGARAGALPLRGVLDLAFAPGAQRAELETRLVKRSGLMGYLGTDDLRQVELRIAEGDALAQQVLEAMLYQVCKEAGAMAATLDFDVQGVAVTGGMVASGHVAEKMQDGLRGLAPVFVYPGDLEMQALAEQAFAVLRGEVEAQEYGDAS